MSSATFDHVTKRFPSGEVAIKDLSLHIPDGEFMVVVGPSGCGKSTLLRMLAGLEEVTEGEISIGDRVVNDVPTQDREISMVFQDYALYPHLTAFDNMSFGLRMQGVVSSEIAWRVSRTADVLELVPYLDRKPRELSGGQQQRVALGRAIVRNPQLFLFDEPLSSLDAGLRHSLRVELQKLHRKLRATFIYVTHDQVEAMTMGDRIAVMKDGEIQQVGTPGQVYDKPANLFVAGFIGSPTMNFIPVSVERRTARGSGLQVDLPLAPRVERGILGIRPEALSEHTSDDRPCIDLRVDMTESLGPDQFVYGLAGSDVIVARVDPRLKVGRGDRLRLAVDQQRLHLFESETGRAIL
jgi:multiple sugar transport system ATP-binding protein